MASTRSKNTPGNYTSEQSAYFRQFDNVIYKNGPSGQAYKTHFAGNGLLPGKCGSMNLSYNYADVESYLLGIGSTNLVNPKPDPVVQLKYIQSINIADKTPVIIPSPFIPASDQRPQIE
jgi:hypothetical protein